MPVPPPSGSSSMCRHAGPLQNKANRDHSQDREDHRLEQNFRNSGDKVREEGDHRRAPLVFIPLLVSIPLCRFTGHSIKKGGGARSGYAYEKGAAMGASDKVNDEEPRTQGRSLRTRRRTRLQLSRYLLGPSPSLSSVADTMLTISASSAVRSR